MNREVKYLLTETGSPARHVQGRLLDFKLIDIKAKHARKQDDQIIAIVERAGTRTIDIVPISRIEFTDAWCTVC